MAATTFPRWAGDGQGSFVWELVCAVRQQGVDVAVCALHTPGAKPFEIIDGIEVYRPRYWWPERAEILRRDGGGLPITLRKYPLAWVQVPIFAAIHSYSIAACARKCDLVHAHWTLSGAAALSGRALHGRPVIVTIHGSDVFQLARYPGGRRFTREILNRSQGATAPSAAVRLAATAAGADAKRIRVISNGVDVGKFVPPVDSRTRAAGGEKVILFVGFLIQRKGVRYLLDALPLIIADERNVRVIIVGEGPEDAALRAQAQALGIADRVDFVGFLPQTEVRAWMQRARVLVLPSLEEGQGVVLLEALACGTPVIASDVDGMREVVTPDVGARFEAGNPQALADALREVLADDLKWETLSLGARTRATQQYDWVKIAQRFVEFYESVLTAAEPGEHRRTSSP